MQSTSTNWPYVTCPADFGLKRVTLLVPSPITFTTLHQAVDVFHGQDADASSVAIVVLVMVVWMYGTLVLAGRRSGYLIILFGSLLGMVVLGVHMSGSRLANSGGGLFFVIILLALGVTSAFSAILAMRGLWSSRPTLAR